MNVGESFEKENLRSQEIIELEYKAMNKYFEIAGISKEQRALWINEYGGALRALVDNKSEFLQDFSESNKATKEEFEEKLNEYL